MVCGLPGADSYETTLAIADVIRPEIRLVHSMNGAPLTQAHGYPVRTFSLAISVKNNPSG